MEEDKLLEEFLKGKKLDKEFKEFKENQKYIGKDFWYYNTSGFISKLTVIKVNTYKNEVELTCSYGQGLDIRFKDTAIDNEKAFKHIFSTEVEALKYEKIQRERTTEFYKQQIIKEEKYIKELENKILKGDKNVK